MTSMSETAICDGVEPMSALRRSSLDELEAVVIAYGKECAAQARAQALEECAKLVESVNNHDNPMTANDCADAIRALAQKGDA